MATETADVLYVPQLAKLLGRTDAAIRTAVNRGADWLPKPFRMGVRLAWRREDVDRFLEERSKQTDGRRTRGRH